MTEFAFLGLSEPTLKAIAETGYTTATPIQEAAIPVALAGRDVLGIAQTGTGKTAAFTLPMIDRLAAGRSKARMPRALVIAPTRELADQVSMSFERYAKYHKLSWALLIGGVSFGDQESKLDRGVDVLIATPGRLLDHFERGKLLLTGVQMLVVDEADRMLDMGFIPDIERIFKMTPPKRQVLFFSATMPPEITRLTKQFLNDPTRIEASRPATTAETITQYITELPVSDSKAKRAALRALAERADVKNGIVFCNRKTEVDIVAKSLKTHGFDASPIHGDLDQATRTRTLESFRKGELKLLVASDVAARGLDIPAVSHVFNYDVPHHADDYVHRIGRTGRAGRTGETYMIVTPADSKSLDKVLKLIGQTPKMAPLDLDWASLTDERGRGGGRSSSSRDGGRRGESRTPTRGRRPVREDSEPQAAEAPAPAPQVEAPAPAPAEVATATPTVTPEDRPRTRSRTRARPEKKAAAAPVEVATPPEPVAAEPAAEDRPPRRTARTTERPIRGVKARDEADDARNGVRGFGGETPAFLLRPTPTRDE
ncbi:MAG: DEAD/DEAH box helicase [Phenylobacterium sp.]|uniref:DEAD/DEAH box helicase n=1 Tax=Phenylobacterium sp. TaxID=1871053 RepID=UPI0027187BAD|nr:DEAD/DEAH box helicase [Phenylobacterium sp.]MDO8899950.1 DEAD/DEAH box helicase [Phenylobacterium sp.]MDP2212498.1 DEAD/DEAH box helicase [Phenylobacterium sp.]